MKVVIPGGSGQVGTILSRHFQAKGADVLILSRGAKTSEAVAEQSASGKCRTINWDAQTLGPWVEELEGTDVLINLSGRIVNCRYNFRNRSEIWSSRTRSVRVLGEALTRLAKPPKLWLQASTATIYSHRFDAPNDEYSGIIGGTEAGAPEKWRFSIDVARAWEGEFALVQTPQTRKVLLRSAMTMSPDPDSIFDYLLWLVRIGLGGRVGSGEQYVSWVHHQDFINAIEFLIAREDLSGAINIASPNPLPHKDFMAALRKAWNRRFALPTYKWMLELGAVFLQTESELVLKSRRVIPSRLLDAGFTFRYPEWTDAAEELCAAWRSAHTSA